MNYKRNALQANVKLGPNPKERRFQKKPRLSYQDRFAMQIGANGSDVPEVKNFDVLNQAIAATVGNNWSVMSGTGATGLLNGVLNGSGPTQVLGRKYNCKSLLVRWSTNVVSSVPIRIVVIYDHAPNSVAPAITDIFTDNSYYAMMNLKNNDRFMVIKDLYVRTLIQDGGPTQGDVIYKKFKNGLQVVTQTSGTPGTITDISTGAFYILVAGVGAVTLTYSSRIRFVDC